ncbi:DUF6308 family protein [Arthrobacter sp. SAFR-179]|uniref:DUF6308 family protein n=1 Tax=Arthrobacter sp. SAFR-179 TaxID=3387279 RepID=UPI003F7BA2DE
MAAHCTGSPCNGNPHGRNPKPVLRQKTAAGVMARKRPGLIPIYDSVVACVTGFRTSAGTWRAWHDALSNDGAKKIAYSNFGGSAQLERISLPRILDVVLWMEGKGFEQPERVGDAGGA